MAVNLPDKSGLLVLKYIERTKLPLFVAVPAVRRLTPHGHKSIEAHLSAPDMPIRSNCSSAVFPYHGMVTAAIDRLRASMR